jgi:hypothetical protein
MKLAGGCFLLVLDRPIAVESPEANLGVNLAHAVLQLGCHHLINLTNLGKYGETLLAQPPSGDFS